MQEPVSKEAGDERRPGAVLAVYSWDMLLALLALLGALAAFGGQEKVGTRTVNIGVPEQVLAALSSASFAALLIILATLLTRRHRWVRVMQIATLGTAILLGAVSLLHEALIPGQELTSTLTVLLVLLIDAIVIVALTGAGIVAWYNGPGSAPRYVSGTLGFWAVSGAVLILLQALR